jgi:hypothetical protein
MVLEASTLAVLIAAVQLNHFDTIRGQSCDGFVVCGAPTSTHAVHGVFEGVAYPLCRLPGRYTVLRRRNADVCVRVLTTGNVGRRVGWAFGAHLIIDARSGVTMPGAVAVRANAIGVRITYLPGSAASVAAAKFSHQCHRWPWIDAQCPECT